MKVLLAHPGTQHAPALAGELERHDLLGEFRTCFVVSERSWPARVASAMPGLPGMRMLRNRTLAGVDGGKIRTDPWNEFLAHWQTHRGRDLVEVIHRRNRSFQERIPERSLRQNDAIIGFDTSSWILAQRAKKMGMPFWLERTTDHPTHWGAIQQELYRRYPEWQERPKPRLAELLAAEEIEHDLAHRILVGSSFVAKSMVAMGVDPSRLVVNPYGVIFGNAGKSEETIPRQRGPIRFLFAGNISARKGIPVLLEAWRMLGWKKSEAELWIVGTIQHSHRRLIPTIDSIRLCARVAKADMAALYRQCDIFVLPSFSEGFGLVLLESLAAGLPVITTYNTGGPDIWDRGEIGCVSIVEAGSVEELADAMKKWKDNPPGRDVVKAACDKLRPRYSWEAYGDRWAALLKEG